MTPERFRRIREVVDRRQPDLTVLMDGVHKPHNLAAIARSCDAVGIGVIHAIGRGGLRLTQKAAGGVGRWVALRRHANATQALEHLRGQGFRILAAHVDPDATDFRQVDYTGPTVIAVGAELEGLSEELLAAAEVRLHIPLLGMVESLNVSVATALVLFEAQRQRLVAGLYARPRLSAPERERLLFELAWPRVAAAARRQGQPYPKLDAAGFPVTRTSHRPAGRRRDA